MLEKLIHHRSFSQPECSVRSPINSFLSKNLSRGNVAPLLVDLVRGRSRFTLAARAHFFSAFFFGEVFIFSEKEYSLCFFTFFYFKVSAVELEPFFSFLFA
jgi:hypothetical protein